jgi:hypothetical protein
VVIEIESSPHTYSSIYFYFTKETKGGKKLYRFEYRGVQTFINSRRMKTVGHLKIIIYFFIYLFLLFFSRNDGSLKSKLKKTKNSNTSKSVDPTCSPMFISLFFF